MLYNVMFLFRFHLVRDSLFSIEYQHISTQKTVKKKNFNEIILKKLQIQLEDLKNQLNQTDYIQIKQDSSSTFINKLFINITPTTTDLKWKQQATTIAGGNRPGNQFNLPVGIYVDDQQQTIYVVDSENHRIQRFDVDTN